MKAPGLDATAAETYAEWFACLADPTRLRILHLLAVRREPMRVGQIVERVEVGQSTVSHHLKRLARTGFVLVERSGTASWFRVNERCLACFPTAAEVVMGRLDPPTEPGGGAPAPPWTVEDDEERDPDEQPATG